MSKNFVNTAPVYAVMNMSEIFTSISYALVNTNLETRYIRRDQDDETLGT